MASSSARLTAALPAAPDAAWAGAAPAMATPLPASVGAGVTMLATMRAQCRYSLGHASKQYAAPQDLPSPGADVLVGVLVGKAHAAADRWAAEVSVMLRPPAPDPCPWAIYARRWTCVAHSSDSRFGGTCKESARAPQSRPDLGTPNSPTPLNITQARPMSHRGAGPAAQGQHLSPRVPSIASTPHNPAIGPSVPVRATH